MDLTKTVRSRRQDRSSERRRSPTSNPLLSPTAKGHWPTEFSFSRAIRGSLTTKWSVAWPGHMSIRCGLPVKRRSWESTRRHRGETLECVVAWLSKPVGSTVSVSAVPTGIAVVGRTDDGRAVVERPLEIGPSRLFGILTEPEDGVAQSARTVVFINRGSGGPPRARTIVGRSGAPLVGAGYAVSSL